MKYMRHEKHGVMPVYDQNDIDRNIVNGWVVDEDYGKSKHVEKRVEKHVENVEHKSIPSVKKRGRPKGSRNGNRT